MHSAWLLVLIHLILSSLRLLDDIKKFLFYFGVNFIGKKKKRVQKQKENNKHVPVEADLMKYRLKGNSDYKKCFYKKKVYFYSFSPNQNHKMDHQLV